MEILGRFGPSVLTHSRLDALIEAGVTILRANGAHSDAAVTVNVIESVRGFAGERARVMVHLPTSKVRVTTSASRASSGPAL